jgi:hypothetical protein
MLSCAGDPSRGSQHVRALLKPPVKHAADNGMTLAGRPVALRSVIPWVSGVIAPHRSGLASTRPARASIGPSTTGEERLPLPRAEEQRARCLDIWA